MLKTADGKKRFHVSNALRKYWRAYYNDNMLRNYRFYTTNGKVSQKTVKQSSMRQQVSKPQNTMRVMTLLCVRRIGLSKKQKQNTEHWRVKSPTLKQWWTLKTTTSKTDIATVSFSTSTLTTTRKCNN